MRPFVYTILFYFFVGIHSGWAQDSVTLISAKMFDREDKIGLSVMKGWLFREGNDSSWANKEINTSGWRELNPTKLSAKLSDRTGRVEGWFRFKFRLDNDLAGVPLGVGRGNWAATDVYVDGNFLTSFGNTSKDSNTYKEYNPIDKFSVPISLEPGKEHIIALHFVDYLAPLSAGLLKSATIGGVRSQSYGLRSLVALTGPKYNSLVGKTSRETLPYRSVWLTVTVLLALFFWLMFSQNRGEKQALLLIAIYSSASALSNLTRFFLTNPDISFLTFRINDLIFKLCTWTIFVLTFLIAKRTLNFKIARYLKQFLIVFSFLGAFSIFSNFFAQLLYLSTIVSFFFYVYILLSYREKLRGAQWAIAVGLSLSILFGALFAIFNFKGYYSNNYWQLLLTGVYFSFPLSLLVYVSLRFKEIMTEVKAKARQLVEITKEREEQTLRQQKILQEEVARQTAELRKTLDDLQSTQTQLIESEKEKLQVRHYKELLNLEAQALRAQMNPHFIYNCMNSIKALIQNDDKPRSIEYLTTFSKLIRTLFQNSDKRQISLYHEIETCRLYIQLEAMRLNGKLKYSFDIDSNIDLKSLMVPALIIQPFIENAIWHGIAPKEGGVINITVKGEKDRIVCEVDDNGIGRERSKLNKPITPIIHESKGVHLSQKRLNLERVLNDTNASIEIIDKYDNDKNIASGTKIILSFNLN
jgi:sensor histidine kinase YesM